MSPALSPAGDPLSPLVPLVLYPATVGLIAQALTLLALFIALLLLSALLVAMETALFFVSSFRGEFVTPHPPLETLKRLPGHPMRTHTRLHVVQVTLLVAAASVGGLLLGLLLPWLPRLITLLVGALLLTPPVLLLGIVLPRSLALRSPERTIRCLGVPFQVLMTLVAPVAALLEAPARALAAASGRAQGPGSTLIRERELVTLVALGGQEGTLEEDEREMVESVLDFGRTTVEDIMTPRPELELVGLDDTRERIAEVFETSRHSRVLVCGDTPDQVVGFIHRRDFLLYPERPWPELLRQPLTVAPTTGLAHLLRMFRERRIFLAVVVDEFGGTKGIVTMKDLLEAIVGKLRDTQAPAPGEVETAEEHHVIRPRGSGTWLVRGRTEIWEFNEKLDAALPDDQARTLSGLVIGLLGHIPREGEEVQTHGWRFRVLQMAGPRIEEMEVSRAAASPGEEAPLRGFPLGQSAAREANAPDRPLP